MEAVLALFEGRGHLALGWVPERLQRELNRLVSQEVRRLHKLSEASRMRSEWEVLPLDEDGNLRSVFDVMPGKIRNGYEELVQQEEEMLWDGRIRELEGSLDGDTEARGLLRCLERGMGKRSEIARVLGIEERQVTAARKRLQRKCGSGRSAERSGSKEKARYTNRTKLRPPLERHDLRQLRNPLFGLNQTSSV